MKKSMMKGALWGGVIVFLWGTISWMILPWHGMTINKFHNEGPLAFLIEQSAPHSGVYALPYPWITEGTSKEEIKEEMEQGPLVFAAVRKEGMGNSFKAIVLSLLADIIAAFFIMWLLLKTRGLIYAQRVGFITMVGLVVALLGNFPNWNWWGFSNSYTLVAMLDVVVAWFFASLAMARYTPA